MDDAIKWYGEFANGLHTNYEDHDEDGIKSSRRALGAPYTGSKNRIAKDIIDLLPRGTRFVDLFSGGGAMTHAAMLSGKYDTYHM